MNTERESLLGRSSCGSSELQLVGQLPARVVELLQSSAVGRSACDSSELQLVDQLPARMVEPLQSSAVGTPCQDHRVCQDLSGTQPPTSPMTSSEPGPLSASQGLLQGIACEVPVQQSVCDAVGMVGRSVGRSVGCACPVCCSEHGASAECLERCLSHADVLPQQTGLLRGVLEVHHGTGNATGGQVEEEPRGAHRGRDGGSHTIRHTLDRGVAACTQLPVVPTFCESSGTWSGPLPLRHNQRDWYNLCFLCGKCSRDGHLMSGQHARNMRSWSDAGKPALKIPMDGFSDRDRLEMSLMSHVVGLTTIQYKAAMERILAEEYYAGVTGTYDGPIPPEIVLGDTAPRGIWLEPEDPAAPEKAPQKAMPPQPSGKPRASRTRSVAPKVAPKMVTVVADDSSEEDWGRWKPERQAPVTPGTSEGRQAPVTPPKPMNASASVLPKAPAMARAPPPVPMPSPVTTGVLPLPPPPPVPAAMAGGVGSTGALLSRPSGDSLYTRERLGLATEEERRAYAQARLSPPDRAVKRRVLPPPPPPPAKAGSSTDVVEGDFSQILPPPAVPTGSRTFPPPPAPK